MKLTTERVNYALDMCEISSDTGHMLTHGTLFESHNAFNDTAIW